MNVFSLPALSGGTMYNGQPVAPGYVSPVVVVQDADGRSTLIKGCPVVIEENSGIMSGVSVQQVGAGFAATGTVGMPAGYPTVFMISTRAAMSPQEIWALNPWPTEWYQLYLQTSMDESETTNVDLSAVDTEVNGYWDGTNDGWQRRAHTSPYIRRFVDGVFEDGDTVHITVLIAVWSYDAWSPTWYSKQFVRQYSRPADAFSPSTAITSYLEQGTARVSFSPVVSGTVSRVDYYVRDRLVATRVSGDAQGWSLVHDTGFYPTSFDVIENCYMRAFQGSAELVPFPAECNASVAVDYGSAPRVIYNWEGSGPSPGEIVYTLKGGLVPGSSDATVFLSPTYLSRAQADAVLDSPGSALFTGPASGIGVETFHDGGDPLPAGCVYCYVSTVFGGTRYVQWFGQQMIRVPVTTEAFAVKAPGYIGVLHRVRNRFTPFSRWSLYLDGAREWLPADSPGTQDADGWLSAEKIVVRSSSAGSATIVAFAGPTWDGCWWLNASADLPVITTSASFELGAVSATFTVANSTGIVSTPVGSYAIVVLQGVIGTESLLAMDWAAIAAAYSAQGYASATDAGATLSASHYWDGIALQPLSPGQYTACVVALKPPLAPGVLFAPGNAYSPVRGTISGVGATTVSVS